MVTQLLFRVILNLGLLLLTSLFSLPELLERSEHELSSELGLKYILSKSPFIGLKTKKYFFYSRFSDQFSGVFIILCLFNYKGKEIFSINTLIHKLSGYASVTFKFLYRNWMI